MVRVIFATILAAAASLPQEMSFHQRPTDVALVLANSRGQYDGRYQLSDVSRVCGELSPEHSGSDRVYKVAFPDWAPDADISDVSFSSKTLVSGVTSTNTFYLSINVRTSKGTRPPAYVLDTTRPNNFGKAELSVKGGTDTIKVTGTNDRGQTVDLTVVCKPKPAALPERR